MHVLLATVDAFSAMAAHHQSFALAPMMTRQSTRRGPPPSTQHVLVTRLCSVWI